VLLHPALLPLESAGSAGHGEDRWQRIGWSPRSRRFRCSDAISAYSDAVRAFDSAGRCADEGEVVDHRGGGASGGRREEEGQAESGGGASAGGCVSPVA